MSQVLGFMICIILLQVYCCRPYSKAVYVYQCRLWVIASKLQWCIGQVPQLQLSANPVDRRMDVL